MGWDLASILELLNARAKAVAVVDANGDQITDFGSSFTPTYPSGSTLSTVALSTTSAVVLAANADRRGFIIKNNDTKSAFIAFAATASTSAYTLEIGGKATYEAPLNGYTGVISAIRASGTGDLIVTEITES